MGRSRSRSRKKAGGKSGKRDAKKKSSGSSGKSSGCSRSRRSAEKKDKKVHKRKGSSSSRGKKSQSRDRKKFRSRDRKKSRSRNKKKSRSRGKKKSRSRGKGSESRARSKKKSRSESKKSRSRSHKAKSGFGSNAATSAPAAQPAQSPAGGSLGVPDWLSDLMGGNGAPAQPQLTSSEPLQIPGALASVMSNESPAIKSIMAQTGATVSIRGDCMHLGYSLAFFTGPAQGVAKAREMVQMQIGVSGNTTITKEIEMSADLLAEGHVDAVLATLQQRGTIVPITIHHTDSSKGLVKIVLGPGPVAYVSTAESLMRKKIDGWLTDGGRQVCGQWRKGNCTFGANCKFRHGLELSSQKAGVPPGQGSGAGTPASEALPLPPAPPMPVPIDNLPPASLRTSATSGML